MNRQPDEDEAVQEARAGFLADVDEVVSGYSYAPKLRHLLDLSVFERTREIFVSEEITEEFGSWFRVVLRYLEAQSHEPITIWIDTPGGDEVSMFAFYDAVTGSPCEVTTVGSGEICSAGVLMLACGSPGHRLVTENCVLMSHEGGRGGAAAATLRHSEAKDRRKFEDWSQAHWFELMARHTALVNEERDAAFWKSITNRKAEYWLLGGEAIIADGIADHIYTPKLLPAPARARI